MKYSALFLLSLSVNATALADECDDANNQSAMNQCYSEQYKKDDSVLNSIFIKVQKSATPEQQKLLKQAQLAWIKLRDIDCELIASGTESGSVQSMIRSQCLSERTRERTAFLESLMQCEEGDSSCPFPASAR